VDKEGQAEHRQVKQRKLSRQIVSQAEMRLGTRLKVRYGPSHCADCPGSTRRQLRLDRRIGTQTWLPVLHARATRKSFIVARNA
jgi:hypothetical protein